MYVCRNYSLVFTYIISIGGTLLFIREGCLDGDFRNIESFRKFLALKYTLFNLDSMLFYVRDVLLH